MSIFDSVDGFFEIIRKFPFWAKLVIIILIIINVAIVFIAPSIIQEVGDLELQKLELAQENQVLNEVVDIFASTSLFKRIETVNKDIGITMSEKMPNAVIVAVNLQQKKAKVLAIYNQFDREDIPGQLLYPIQKEWRRLLSDNECQVIPSDSNQSSALAIIPLEYENKLVGVIALNTKAKSISENDCEYYQSIFPDLSDQLGSLSRSLERL